MTSLQYLLQEAARRCRPRSVEVNRICSRCFRQHVHISKSTLLPVNKSKMRLSHNTILSRNMKQLPCVSESFSRIYKKSYSGQNFDKDSEELIMLKQKFVKEKSQFNSETGQVLSEISHVGNEMDAFGAKLENRITVSQDNDSDMSDSEGLLTDVESDSESSSSSSDEGDLVSDESSDEEGKFVTSSLGEGEVINDLNDMKKEGLTAEEMIELIEQFGDMEGHSEEEPGDESNTQLATESESHNNYDKVKEDAVYSSPSQHFDESGVISLVDHDMEKDKSLSKDWSVEEIEDFVNITTEEVVELPWQPAVSLQRGVEGVFDIHELVELLQVENIQDLVTIRIPPERNFGDYMVIGTAKSFRHLSAVSENVNWIYKQRKIEAERFLKQEGKKQNSGWIAIDLGNIILHLFLPDQRELYDLETLWTVGSKYDTQSLEEEDPYALSLDDHPWLKELEEQKSGNVNK